MMYPTGFWRSRYMIPPEKLKATVASRVVSPTFSNSVVNTDVRLIYEMLNAVNR
jgi:hypothetical protein